MSLPVDMKTNKSKEDALSRIVRLVEFSDRPISVIIKRLEREGYSNDEIDCAVNRAKELGVLDDERYARVYCRSKLARLMGSQGIIRDLHSMGIFVEEMQGYPEDFLPDAEEDEYQRAFELLKRKPPYGKNIREKAYQTLKRKGYSSSVSSTVAREWCDKISFVSEPKSSDFLT